MDHLPAYPAGPRVLADEVLRTAAAAIERAAAIQRAASDARQRAVLARQEAERARASAIRALHSYRRREQRMAAGDPVP